MLVAPIPPNEELRLAALYSLQVLDTTPEERFDRITRLAQQSFGVSISLVSLVDAERQWFKSRQGLDVTETPRDISFCGHAVAQDNPLFYVENAATDERFADNPLVTDFPNIRFYAGCVLSAPDGSKIGTLCVIDDHPRVLTPEDQATLRDLGAWAMNELNSALLSRALLTQRRLDEEKDAFVSTVSHEMRTPLTSITGALNLLTLGIAGELPEKAGELIHIASQNSERLARLINDLLDIEKIESGKLELHLESVELDSLVDEAIRTNEPYGIQYEVSFHSVETTPDLIVNGDRDRLIQVLTNLLSNAAKFSPAGSTVELRLTRADDKYARLEVRDYGDGIPKEAYARMYEKFMQFNKDPTKRRVGTGLGLAICKLIVERHRGRISFESELGVGTTFYVDLPVAAGDSAQEAT